MADDQTWRNWSGQVTSHPSEAVTPQSVDEVAAVVRQAAESGRTVKAVGSGHSFSAIAATTGVLLRPEGLEGPFDVDTGSGLVTVGAGLPLHKLNPLLAEHGLAMENLGDIDRQTIAGAVTTGTHGTGAGFGSISTQLRALGIVLADGSVLDCSAEQNPDVFRFARISLGALGVLTEVTLQCVPSFALHVVEEPMPLARVLEELPDLVDGNDHFEFFWFPHTRTALTKRMRRLPADTELAPLSPLRRRLDDDLITNVGFEGLLRLGTKVPRAVPGITRLVTRSLSRREYTDLSHRVFASRRDVRFNEGEYAVARDDAAELLRTIDAWVAGHDEKISFPLEVRFVQEDDIPLSPVHERPGTYVAFHQYHRMPHQPYFDALEAIFAGFDGRPHWGKMHSLDRSRLSALYPGFAGFAALRDRLDPTGVFANPYLDTVLGRPPSRS